MDAKWKHFMQKIERNRIMFKNLRNYKPENGGDVLKFPVLYAAVEINKSQKRLSLFDSQASVIQKQDLIIQESEEDSK